jgi:hypothetical protein
MRQLKEKYRKGLKSGESDFGFSAICKIFAPRAGFFCWPKKYFQKRQDFFGRN